MIIAIILTFLSFALLATYIGWSIKKIGYIPKSLSKSYYLIPEKKRWYFQFTLMLMGILLMPAWIIISPDLWMFLGVLTCFAIIFVGAAPKFLHWHEKNMHTISAWCAAAFSICWSILAYDYLWICPVVCGVAAGIMALIQRKSYYFWLEMGAFLSAFISVTAGIFIKF